MLNKIREMAQNILLSASELAGKRSVDDVQENGGVVKIVLSVSKVNPSDVRMALEDDIRQAVSDVFSDKEVRVMMLANDAEEEDQPHPSEASSGHGSHDLPPKKPIPGVKHVYLICSAKGGVGKSTVALNTALALQLAGHRTALLDLDLYGPSLPALVGKDLQPEVIGNLIVPPVVHDMAVLSIGFMIDADQPLMWRGPMVAGVINQLLFDVDWSGHDTLVIDMPPGTGDTYLSILQSIEVDAAILVTTPSELALVDVKRGVGVYEPYNVPVAGIVENMATYEWEGRANVMNLLDEIKPLDESSAKNLDRVRKMIDTTRAIRIFGNSTKALCDEMHLPLIASIPLDIALQNDNDAGTPYMLNPKKEAIRKAFEGIASFILKREQSSEKV